MPQQGFKVVTISEEVHRLAERFLEEYNKAVGWKKIRSLSHLFELAVIEYIEKNQVKVKVV
jgi:hypothetical protein